jgi:uncharacterized membrane protein
VKDRLFPNRATLREAGDPLGAKGRLFVSLLAGLIVMLILSSSHIVIRLLAAWNAGSLVLLVLAWRIIRRSNAAQTQLRAATEDPGRYGVFIVVIVSSLASIAAALAVLRNSGTMAPDATGLVDAMAVAAILEAWCVTHTSYTLRYAHLYYREDGDVGGISFNSDDQPDDMDFAYFAFIVGMTFQVADTNVSDKSIRHTVLGHALISFVYNTVIVALALNLFFGLLSK